MWERAGGRGSRQEARQRRGGPVRSWLSFGGLLDNHPSDVLTAKRDHGHTRSGIDAAANEEQVVELGALLWSFESEVAAAIADYTVDGASIGCVPSLDVEWGPEVLNDDVLPQIGEAYTLKLVEAEFF